MQGFSQMLVIKKVPMKYASKVFFLFKISIALILSTACNHKKVGQKKISFGQSDTCSDIFKIGNSERIDTACKNLYLLKPFLKYGSNGKKIKCKSFTHWIFPRSKYPAGFFAHPDNILKNQKNLEKEIQGMRWEIDSAICKCNIKGVGVFDLESVFFYVSTINDNRPMYDMIFDRPFKHDYMDSVENVVVTFPRENYQLDNNFSFVTFSDKSCYFSYKDCLCELEK